MPTFRRKMVSSYVDKKACVAFWSRIYRPLVLITHWWVVSIMCISYLRCDEIWPHRVSNSSSLLSNIRKFSRVHRVCTSPTNARSALWSTNTRCHQSAQKFIQLALYATIVSSYQLFLRDLDFWPLANNKHMPGTIETTWAASFATLSPVGHHDRPKYRPFRKSHRLVMRER